MANATIAKSPRRTGTPPHANAIQDPFGEGKALISRLKNEHGIDIAEADKATKVKYDAFTEHHPSLHPACALWLARQCLVKGNAERFCDVVTTFALSRLQGIVEGAGIVASCLEKLPHVHQIEFASGCELTTECVEELSLVLLNRRKAPFELNLHSCTIRCDALLSLTEALADLRGLAMLSISDLDVTGDADWITALAKGLARNAELLAFKLDVPDLTPEQAKAMGQGLRGCRSLTELHLIFGNLASLTHLLGSLGEQDLPDPDSPGTATRPLTTVRIIGRPGPAQPLFPKGSVQFLSQFIASCPSLGCIHISPSLHVRSFAEFEKVMDLCGSSWKHIEIDIDFSLLIDKNAKTKSGELIERGTGRVLKRTSAYIRRKDASHRLPSEAEFLDFARRLLPAALQSKLLPADPVREIALRLVTGRSPRASPLMTLNTLSRINRATVSLGSVAELLRSACFERMKGLMTFSAFAFGTQLADPLCFILSRELRGGRLSEKEEKALTSLIKMGRPDSAALKKTIREAELHRWRAQQDQVRLLLACGFKDEFLLEQQIRWKFQSRSTKFPVTLEDKRLETEADKLRVKEIAKDSKKAVSKLFSKISKKKP